MTRSFLKSAKTTLYLHIFVEGSGERAIQRSLYAQAPLTEGFAYPSALPDFISGIPCHTYINNILFGAISAHSEEVCRYYLSLFDRFWQRVAAACGDYGRVFLSLGCSPYAWELFWQRGGKALDFSDIAIQPLVTLHPQEDYQETFYRGWMWHRASPAALQPRPNICNYARMLESFEDLARDCHVSLEPPRVFWKGGPTEDDEWRVAEQVLEVCGVTASRGLPPPDHLFLQTYDATRFSNLVFPVTLTSAGVALGLRPRFPGNLWKSGETRSCYAALREGERQGLFSPLPCSAAALRQKAHDLGAEGNERLGRRFPELVEAMAAPPRCPADMPGEEPHSLTGEGLDRCLRLFSSGQRAWIRHCLDMEFTELTEEQKEIRDRLRPPSTSPCAAGDCDVSVLTLAYNQKEYIARTIESVLAQKCSHSLRHIIVDDGSDDGTQDIIAAYANRYPHIKPFFLHRFYKPAGSNVQVLFGHCRTRYAALCDGDDYFTDPYKLQKQIDFLEQHPDCAICFHPVDVLYGDGSPKRVYPTEDMLPGGVRDTYTLEDLLMRNFIQTNAAVYRWRFRDGLPDWFVCDLVPGDWYWHILHAETGKIAYLKESMSVYWRHADSFYASAEGSHVDHRKEYGLRELRVYDVLNRHFRGRHYGALCRLAMGVLSNFMQHYMTTGDDSLLRQASERYPNFTRSFLSRIKRDLRVKGGGQRPS